LDLELLIIGEGEERTKLEALITELGHRDRIKLLGYRADMLELYPALDVFALSSRREAFPNVVLEAMATDVPVVATAVAGVPDIIESGVNGILVKPDSVDEMSAALTRLIGDSALRYRIGAAGRGTIEARFSFRVRMQKVQRIYDQLLGLETRTACDREEVSAPPLISN
jgi:glycosyltransferase involved in cell wall biosynthesis